MYMGVCLRSGSGSGSGLVRYPVPGSEISSVQVVKYPFSRQGGSEVVRCPVPGSEISGVQVVKIQAPDSEVVR